MTFKTSHELQAEYRQTLDSLKRLVRAESGMDTAARRRAEGARADLLQRLDQIEQDLEMAGAQIPHNPYR
jgi:predicted nuclease with TOPRIM domain